MSWVTAGVEAEGAAGIGAVKRAVPQAEYVQIKVAAAALAARALWFMPARAADADGVDLEPCNPQHALGAASQGSPEGASMSGAPARGEASPAATPLVRHCLGPKILHITVQIYLGSVPGCQATQARTDNRKECSTCDRKAQALPKSPIVHKLLRSEVLRPALQAPADTNAWQPAPSAAKRARPARAPSAAPAAGAAPGGSAVGVAGATPEQAGLPGQGVTREAVAAHLKACGGATAHGLARHFGCSARTPNGCAPLMPAAQQSRRRMCKAAIVTGAFRTKAFVIWYNTAMLLQVAAGRGAAGTDWRL